MNTWFITGHFHECDFINQRLLLGVRHEAAIQAFHGAHGSRQAMHATPHRPVATSQDVGVPRTEAVVIVEPATLCRGEAAATQLLGVAATATATATTAVVEWPARAFALAAVCGSRAEARRRQSKPCMGIATSMSTTPLGSMPALDFASALVHGLADNYGLPWTAAARAHGTPSPKV